MWWGDKPPCQSRSGLVRCGLAWLANHPETKRVKGNADVEMGEIVDPASQNHSCSCQETD